jgi:hypothetical protein
VIVVDRPLTMATGIGCVANRAAGVLPGKQYLPPSFAETIEAQRSAALLDSQGLGIAGIFPAGRADRFAEPRHI